MHLNFKILIALFFCTQLGWSQEEEEKNTGGIQEFELFFEIGYAQPISYGDNFINKGYDLSGTIDVGITTAFFYNTTLHSDINITSGDVTRPDLIGNIRSANFTRVSLGLGYPLEILDKLRFLPSIHVGYLKIGQNTDNGEFRDDGGFVAIEMALNYRIIKWIDISLGAKNYFDFLSIDAPSETGSFFDSAQSIYPFLGLRFRVGK